MIYFVLLIFPVVGTINSTSGNTSRFPDEFLFGVGSSAYQIEGAWNEGGKSENIWDYWTHTRPYFVLDGRNADISSNSYYKTTEDIELLQNLGVDFYKLSLSWSRILPTGLSNYVNKEGLNYYKNLLRNLKDNGIQTMVVIYNWDMPIKLYLLGSWVNKKLINYYVEYSKTVINELGDSVDYWLTFHDPYSICVQDRWSSGIHDYTCMHNILKAHAYVYHYYKEFTVFSGMMSIDMHSFWYSALLPTSANVAAAERIMQFSLGWYANPIFNGDYPAMMKERIKERSLMEGLQTSRLPDFTQDEISYIKNTADFFALSHFTSYIAYNKDEAPYNDTSFNHDVRVKVTEHYLSSISASDWLRVHPKGLREILKWIDTSYSSPNIYITSNGYSDNGELDDKERINYHYLYFKALLQAIHDDGINVKAYTAWSFLDSFEWTEGYSHRFGMYHVNFTVNGRTRSPKASCEFYKTVIKERVLHCSIC